MGLAHLCIDVSLFGVTATRLFCALVFPSVGQDLRNNQTKTGYPEGFGRALQPFVLLSVNLCLSATRKYVQVALQALVQASLPTRTNQLHVNPRDSISGFLQSRFTNNKQKKLNKCSATAVVWSTARSTSQQVTKVRTHAHLGLSSNTWHKRMPHDSPFLSVGHSVERKSRQEMIILSLPRRESF